VDKLGLVIFLIIVGISVIGKIKESLERSQNPPPKRRPPSGGQGGHIPPGTPTKGPADAELREFLKNLSQGRTPAAKPQQPEVTPIVKPAAPNPAVESLGTHAHETVAEHAGEIGRRNLGQLDIDEDILDPLDERKPLIKPKPGKQPDPYRFKARPEKRRTAAPKPKRPLGALETAKAMVAAKTHKRRVEPAVIASAEIGLMNALPQGLSPMQKAIALTEILGPPVSAREREDFGL